MKKVVLASLLTVASATPCLSFAQTATPNLGTSAQSGGQVTMSQEEYAAYNNATTQTTPAAKAAAFEAYLKAYPNSSVKADALTQMLYAYTQANDQTGSLSAADRLLAVDSNNLRALAIEVYFRRASADQLTDAAAKVAALDAVAKYAQTGLATTKPKDMAQTDFDSAKKQAAPTFESAIGDDDLAKKDYAGAIAAYKAEIGMVPAEQTQAPGPVLQDMVFLANAYMLSTPPDYLSCAWYAQRAANFAGQYATAIQPTATYCYQKYHGSKEGIDALTASAKTGLTPPDTLGTTIKAAPKPEDIVSNLIATTPDLATLALSDKEFVLQYGKQADADKVFDTIKGKAVSIPGAVVVAATESQLQVSVSDDAIQSKTADFTFNMKAPLTKVPAVGEKIELSGVYASYTQTPLMITMSDAEVIAKKAPAKAAAPAHKAPVRRK